MAEEKILLFIPAYNCKEQIIRVLNKLDDSFMQFINHTIIVNNCSLDDTEAIAVEWLKEHDVSNVTALRNDSNIGYGGNHKVGFQYAIDHGFDYIIVLHGDDQADPHDLIPILETKKYLQYDCCLGARFMTGSRLIGYSRFRTFGNKVFNLLFSIALGKRIYDCGCGLKIYSTEMIKDRYYLKFPDELWFEYAMTMALFYYKQNFCYFPVTWREEDQVSNVKLVRQTLIVLKMLFSYMLSPKHYMQADHRTRIDDTYLSNVVYEGGNDE